ncbi:nuclear transport factor 2 family protein [Caulobacter sp.]|uniref:nuclear transport factor 2 family protein n=1 Tax=Caulobacter sp. TaxID=78 RepID=UPI003BA8C56F
MTTPQDAIAARRKLTNKLIAGKVAARLAPFFDPKVVLIAGDGSLLMGAAEVIAAFDAQFRDPDFIAYVRTSEATEIDSAGLRAAERGRWVGAWKGTPDQSGTYLATWKKVTGQWVIESELYVTLDRGR